MEPTGNSPSAQPANPPQFRKFPIDQIKPSRTQARKSFAEEALRDLAASMKENGLIVPINIRLLADGSAEPVAGERRLRAAKLLGWTALDAIVASDVSDQAAAVKGLIENLQRVDLNPIEEAIVFATLQKMDPKTWTQETIASRLKGPSLYKSYRGLLGSACGGPGKYATLHNFSGPWNTTITPNHFGSARKTREVSSR